jgi:flagellar basal-body rod protein FlgF
MAASGMRARLESLDLLANNIANASTSGYKADREYYNLYAAPEAEGEDAATMPVIERQYTDLGQGVLQNTGNALDFALSGQGFFVAQGPKGPLYTRNGSFRVSSDGKLITADGYGVTASGGNPIKLDKNQPIEVSSDGTVTQAGTAIGQLQLAGFTSAAGLTKQGSNYFRAVDPAEIVALPKGTTVEQGKIEAANGGASEAAVGLISIMRQFEMLQKAALMGADMEKQAIEQVAKVSQ